MLLSLLNVAGLNVQPFEPIAFISFMLTLLPTATAQTVTPEIDLMLKNDNESRNMP